MVYINSDGSVCNRAPFGLSTITRLFWGFLNFFYMFFRTLINPRLSQHDSRYSTDYRSPGSGPPKPPRFRGFGSSGAPGAPPAPGCGCG